MRLYTAVTLPEYNLCEDVTRHCDVTILVLEGRCSANFNK